MIDGRSAAHERANERTSRQTSDLYIQDSWYQCKKRQRRGKRRKHKETWLETSKALTAKKNTLHCASTKLKAGRKNLSATISIRCRGTDTPRLPVRNVLQREIPHSFSSFLEAETLSVLRCE